MAHVPVEHALLLAGILFALGLVAVLSRRNLIFMLFGLEVMLNAAGLAFIAVGSYWGQTDGEIMFVLILTLAGTEAAIALALVLQLDRRLKSLDAEAPSRMRG